MAKKIAERVYEWWTGSGGDRSRATGHSRSYGAANRNRGNSDWTSTTTTSNYETYVSITALRARSRQMCRDDAFFRKFLQMAESNVIGRSGIQIDPRAYLPGKERQLNKDLNDRVKRAFWEWGSNPENCSVTGKLDFAAQQRLFVRTLLRDGEVLVVKQYSGPWGFQLKFIDPAYLDEFFNAKLTNGNRIIMSVEVDPLDKPVAYWLTEPSADSMFYQKSTSNRKRYTADEIIHAFVVIDDESQIRGITHFAAGLLTGKNRNEFAKAVLMQCKMTAMAGGFLIPPVDETNEYSGEDSEGRVQAPEIDWKPASMPELPPGYDFKEFDPKQPTQNHPAYMEVLISELAASFGVHYFTLAGDMSAVNYSSARIGLGEERDGIWGMMQDFVITHFCARVYNDWLPSAIAAKGKLKIVSNQEKDAVAVPYWQPRGWDYIDPQKEINAQLLGVESGLLTVSGDVLGKRGKDLRDMLETAKQDRQMFEEFGLDYPSSPQKDTSAVSPLDPAEDMPEKKGKSTEAPAKRAYLNGEDHDELLN